MRRKKLSSIFRKTIIIAICSFVVFCFAACGEKNPLDGEYNCTGSKLQYDSDFGVKDFNEGQGIDTSRVSLSIEGDHLVLTYYGKEYNADIIKIREGEGCKGSTECVVSWIDEIDFELSDIDEEDYSLVRNYSLQDGMYEKDVVLDINYTYNDVFLMSQIYFTKK